MPRVTDLLPHREPFLFIDEILEQRDDYIKATRIIRAEEPFFAGHYPGNPVMPGVLLLETMYQAGALIMASRDDTALSGTPVVTRSDNVKFRKMVRPGDQVTVEATFVEQMANAYCFKGKITVNGKTAASCEYMCTVVGGE